MAISFGIVVVPSCSGDRLFRPNLSAVCSVSSSACFRLWHRRIDVGTGVISARRRRETGLSFRTTEDNLRNAFEQFGKLVLVNLVMDKVANRPRGFAFLRYETEEESMKAIEGMHGKFLDGRVIFVEEAKPRSDIQRAKPRSDINRAQSKPRKFRTW
ncbi:unnamed protein product [Arabis nemorensis]|uniref:RRM domain-containing protein n=1 Tax=Arabis nemorensis TaxID=586526 RepID=A0A565B0I1_9BRAS|nr:unnamed protein product [Arabis nemorensis]